MIVEHRPCELQPDRLRDFLAVYEQEGLLVQRNHAGNLIGFFTAEVGYVNEIVHIWAFEVLGDLQQTSRSDGRRSGMASLFAEEP